MEKVSRSVGRGLTETKRKDFDQQVGRLAEFLNVSQFDAQPSHVSQVGGQLMGEARLSISHILYGVEQDGSLLWLGEIIDSSD